MTDPCICYLPGGSTHCTRCHITFAERHEATDHLSEQPCPIAECHKCGTAWWLSHSPGAPVPAGGTWCICIGCGEAAIFTGRGLEVREPSPDESSEIGQDLFVLQYRQDRDLTRRTN